MKVGDWIKYDNSDYQYHLGVIVSLEGTNTAIVDMKVLVWLENYQAPRSYMQGLHRLTILETYNPTIKELFKIKEVQDAIKNR